MAFFPLRWAEIVSFGPEEIVKRRLAQDETRLAITFRLDRFVYADPTTTTQFAAAATSIFRGYKVRPYRRGEGGEDSRWVLFGSYSEPGTPVDAQTAWLAHAEQLAECPSLREALIFQVSRPQYVTWRGKSKELTIGSDPLLGDAYKLRARKQYKLEVSFYLRSGALRSGAADPKDLVRADVSSANVRRTAPISTALGEETVARIFFGAEALAADELATVTVQGPKEIPSEYAPTVAFIVRFRPGWFTIVVGVAAVAIGVLIGGLSADDWKELSLHLSFRVLLAIKVVGALLVAFGVLYAFRRGPSGGQDKCRLVRLTPPDTWIRGGPKRDPSKGASPGHDKPDGACESNVARRWRGPATPHG